MGRRGRKISKKGLRTFLMARQTAKPFGYNDIFKLYFSHGVRRFWAKAWTVFELI